MADPTITASQVKRAEGALKKQADAAVAITRGQWVYLDSKGKLRLAINSSQAEAAAVGVALQDVAADQPCDYQYGGDFDMGAGAAWPSGAIGIVSSVAGNVSRHIDYVDTSGEIPADLKWTTSLGVGIGNNKFRIGIVHGGQRP